VLQEGADMPFNRSEALGFSVQGLVGLAVGGLEIFIAGFQIPEVHSEVSAGAGKIFEEASPVVVGVAAKELNPGALEPIGVLKAFFASRLDFELPEDYKHRCPVFCPRHTAFQDNSKVETGVQG
jgi:hypothetical protein